MNAQISGLRIGRAFAVELQVAPSMLFILFLVAFHLGAGVLPSLHPDWPGWQMVVVALAARVLLVVSVLVQELAQTRLRSLALRLGSPAPTSRPPPGEPPAALPTGCDPAPEPPAAPPAAMAGALPTEMP